jgi:hypothetical protein
MGMLFRYLVWLEVGQEGVIGMEVARISPAAEPAQLLSIPAEEKSMLG